MKGASWVEQDSWANKLYEGYCRQKTLYEALLVISTLQCELLSRGENEGMIEAVQEKGRLIEEIRAIETELSEARNKWPEIRKEIESSLRGELEELVGQIRELIENILEKDRESEVLLKHWMGEMAARLQQVRQGRSATNAYKSQTRNQGPEDSVLFDRKE